MHAIKLYVLITLATASTALANTPCDPELCENETPTLDIELEIKDKFEPDSQNTDFNNEIKLQPQIRLMPLPNEELKSKQDTLNNIAAFTKPYQRRGIDNTHSNDRAQYSLDNFHLPSFTCTLPNVQQVDDVEANYDRAKIAVLDKSLIEYYHCINQAAESDRTAFKQLITGKLGGKIVSSTDNNLKWAVLPEHTTQTRNIMDNIKFLYEQRFSDYETTHADLQEVINQWNAFEYSQ